MFGLAVDEELFGEVVKVGGVKFLGNCEMTSVIVVHAVRRFDV